MRQLISVLIGAYLAGSINFAIVLFKILKKEDPRKAFSGNPGTTNVYRQAGLFWAVVVLVLDVARAVTVALAAAFVLKLDFVPWAGLALILGNHFPCFHNFRGGKGVANYLGFTAAIAPLAAAISALAWGATYALVRKPFIGSLAMVSVLAAGSLYACNFKLPPAAGTLATAALIYYCHKGNIYELIGKKEK